MTLIVYLLYNKHDYFDKLNKYNYQFVNVKPTTLIWKIGNKYEVVETQSLFCCILLYVMHVLYNNSKHFLQEVSNMTKLLQDCRLTITYRSANLYNHFSKPYKGQKKWTKGGDNEDGIHNTQSCLSPKQM